MKNISIISPDTVPLQLTFNAPKIIYENSREYSREDRCSRSTRLGLRAWKMAEELSSDEDFRVTLYIPDIYYPGDEYIVKDNISFIIKTYNIKVATWNWSEELDRKLKGEDFVIVQPSTGVGLLNCSVLPNKTNVILDGFVSMFAEMPCTLLGSSQIYKKIHWTRFADQYRQLIHRVNCILYANDNQFCYYEGQLLSLNKLDWGAYQFSPLLKVPYGLDRKETIIEKPEKSKTFRILWYGQVYPWYYPEALIDILADIDNISIDFVNTIHPREKRSYYNYFSKFFEKVSDISNIQVHEKALGEKVDLYKEYDAGIVFARDWIEERYSVRSRALDMVSAGLPVLLNKGNPLFSELEMLGIKDSLYPITEKTLVFDIQSLNEDGEKKVKVSKKSFNTINNSFNWEETIAPLKDYIQKFFYDDTKKYWYVPRRVSETSNI